jgi:uncharacterized protein
LIEAAANVFRSVRARYIVVAWLLLPFYAPGLGTLLTRFAMEWPYYWWEIVTAHYSYGLLILAAIASIAAAWPMPVRACLGRLPSKSEFVGGAKLTAFLVLVSIASACALFYPLSYIAPDFVTWWYIDTPSLIYYDGERFPLIANALALLLLCVFVPIVEEFVFRAIILPRWAHKWGLRSALIGSSALFAIVHADPIGAFLFAIGMSVLYLRTQSLYLPIFCHALNNLLAWLAEWAYIAVNGPLYEYTLQDFRDEWLWGAVTAIAAAVWVAIYLERPRKDIAWKFPVA